MGNQALYSTAKPQTDLLERLKALPGVDVTEIEPQYDFLRTFEIDLTQPVNHHDPDGQTFKQRIYLSHRNESAPMVLHPSGYSVSARSIQEIVDFYTVNHISVTHRYMAESKPQPIDWQYLTIEQAAADHHRVVTLFKQIYNGIWISTGASKSGQTALFHRRFYPDDVQGTITFGSPILFSSTDPRFDHFLENIAGDEDSRTKIKQFQRTVLINREDILPLVRLHLENMGYGYSLGEDVILEFAILEYPFYFWSFGSGDSSEIPDTTASAQELLDHLLEIISLLEYTDVGNEYYKPVYYQLYTEIGYYRLRTDYLADLLVALANPTHKIFAPNSDTITFKPEVMEDIHAWLQNEGNNIIYIYGGQDTWTAAAVELTGQTNAIKIVQPGANHFLRIADLDFDKQQLILSTLDQWLNLTGMTEYQMQINDFKLSQNYPNPFNPSTTIQFQLPKSSFVTLKIFSVLGKEIETLFEGRKTMGEYQVTWTAKGLPSGIYLVYLRADDFVGTKKVILQK